MHKGRSAGLVLLTVVLVLLGAGLPRLIAGFGSQEEKVFYENMEPVELQIVDTEQRARTVPEKLSILRYEGQTVYVDEKLMVSEETEIREAIEVYLENCRRAGALPADAVIGDWVVIKPCMIFDYNEGDTYDFFWDINLHLESAEGAIEIYATMDDYTHHVFRMNIGGLDNAYDVSPEAERKFADFFFRELGITPEPAEEEDGMLRYALTAGEEYEFLFVFYDFGNGFNLYIS